MSNHLTYFKVENFKKFDTLELNNLGQFNLITGDNNVGKSCLLESLLVSDNDRELIKRYHNSLTNRHIHFHIKKDGNNKAIFPPENYIDYLKNKISNSIQIQTNENNCKIDTKTLKQLTDNEKKANPIFSSVQDIFSLNGLPSYWTIVYRNNIATSCLPLHADEIDDDLFYSPLISINHFYNDDLLDFLKEYIKTIDDKQNILIELSFLIPGVIDISMEYFGSNRLILIATESNKTFHPITQYGDGVSRLLRILLEIKKCEGQRLMIDEIEIGIHFSNLKGYWTKIFQFCKLYNVQLFATTHSKECIETFIDASVEVENIKNEIRLIELKEFDSQVYANTLALENIEAAMESEINIRGGNIYGKH